MTSQAAGPHPGLGFRQFIALVASLMAINALSIDIMLPALPQIGDALSVDTENHRQWIVTAYLLGFGGAQIIYGPISDRYGRKRILLIGLAVFVLASIAAIFASSFEAMIAARAVQGIGIAATRVLVISIVRDCYSGRKMARVMSLAFIVFVAVPVLAPSIGQFVLLIAPWRWIFVILSIAGVGITLWVIAKLPETLHAENRLPLSFGGLKYAFMLVVTNRLAVGYMMAVTMMMGGLFGFVNSAQQIFFTALDAADVFTLVFAAIAIFMGASSFLNASIVERLGSRLVSHSALFGYIFFGTVHLFVALLGYENIWTFWLLQSGLMFCFGLLVSNFNSMAMEPLGHVAGTASSVMGFFTTLGGALLGAYVGQHFDGTVVPFTLGLTLFGFGALAMVLFAERGRLFRAHHAPVH
ncbi:Bcr/CflA family drug resistance efflux transporter [Agaricicola taiwanensis]|uniref:Bcr/CflA family efflux transporter n=1 Tax=Agaricicola taiwanensis TaxID=591372 RepID=A0A8J2VUQ9_9RHOB|nr:multidrug effflux MFS transporter [Agaricicola taiwanensis]GGE39065.1 Bcr/CflA family drug resistance efflux transporter [Agaricicola taiwanensis]